MMKEKLTFLKYTAIKIEHVKALKNKAKRKLKE